ncbi:MAG: HD domain-containing protein [Thermoplasmatota archaeon]
MHGPATGIPAPKKVRDPIHNYIHLDGPALSIINTPVFQRLRWIRQLGTALYVYPGAQHTRFEHGLGAMHLAGLACESLGLGPVDSLHVRLAALLHDVGHGPFSHLTEEIVREATGKSHVDLGCDIIMGPLSDPLRTAGADPAAIAKLLHGEGVLGPLISGDLDVDRMDYLVRDSHYTGVDLGVDLYRLVTSMRRVDGGFALEPSAIPAAELFLATRGMMYATVYYHPTGRAAEVMVERAIRFAIQEGLLRATELHRMDDIGVWSALRASKGRAGHFTAALEERRLLKLVAEVRASDIRGFVSGGANRGLATRDRAEAEARLAKVAGCAAEEVIFDVPPFPEVPDVSVSVLEDGACVPLRERSALVANLPKSRMDHWRARAFVPASAREGAARHAREILLETLSLGL